MNYREDVLHHLKKNPSLKSYLAESLTYAYGKASLKAADETGLSYELFPEEMPYSLKNVLKEGWLPE